LDLAGSNIIIRGAFTTRRYTNPRLPLPLRRFGLV